MRKDVKICVKKKVKKAQKYEHVRRRSKPCDNMENNRQWKRYNQRDEAQLLSGWGLETRNVSHCQLHTLSTWCARVKTSIEVPKGSVLSASHVNP